MSKPEKFEQALKKLEQIVDRIESGNLSLEDSLKSFEEGVRLARECEKRLTDVKRKIEILTKDRRREEFQPGE